MSILVFMSISVIVSCSSSATSQNFKMSSKSLEPTLKIANVQTPMEKQVLRLNPYLRQNSFKLNELDKITNIKTDTSNRKSKILRSLAFLAGLSVGNLAGTTSLNAKAYAKSPPLNLNVDETRMSPEVAAIYNPHPYVFATPVGFYTILNPLTLHSINGNSFHPLMQNSQGMNLLDGSKLMDLSDEYVDETKKVEHIKSSNSVEKFENIEENMEKIVKTEDKRKEEDNLIKMSPGVGCNIQKEVKHNVDQGSFLESSSEEPENAEDSLKIPNLRAINTTKKKTSNATHGHLNQPISGAMRNETNATLTLMQNSTTMMINNNQTNSPFYGYYGGYPQDINHIDFTTEPYDHKYENTHAYENINYHLPSYEKPGNFHLDNRFNYYQPMDSYQVSQFHHQEIPEYSLSDFKRFLYASDNTPFANSEFRPVM